MNDQIDKERGKKEGRSPGYPAISLHAALEKARIIMEKEKKHFAPITAIFGHWGYGDKSSMGHILLASLKKYGLVEDRGSAESREAKITDLAWEILVDERADSKERAELIKESALNPHIHQKLWADYNGQLPSDDNLRHRLLTRDKFTRRAVDDFIRQFRATIEFAKLGKSDSILEQEEEKPSPIREDTMTAVAETRQAYEDHGMFVPIEKNTVQGPISFPLSPSRWVHVSLPQNLTRKEWSRMLKKLEMFKDGFMDPSELDEGDE